LLKEVWGGGKGVVEKKTEEEREIQRKGDYNPQNEKKKNIGGEGKGACIEDRRMRKLVGG